MVVAVLPPSKISFSTSAIAAIFPCHPYCQGKAERYDAQTGLIETKQDNASDGKDYGHNNFKVFHNG